MTLRNERRPAFTGIDQDEVTTVARQIDCGGEPRRTTADDHAIEQIWFGFTPLFDRRRHLGNRHQRLRDLIEQLVGILFFAERLGE